MAVYIYSKNLALENQIYWIRSKKRGEKYTKGKSNTKISQKRQIRHNDNFYPSKKDPIPDYFQPVSAMPELPFKKVSK